MQNREKLDDLFKTEGGAPPAISPDKGLMYNTNNRADGSKNQEQEDNTA